MLSGKRAFGGDSVADTLATVMKLNPDWSALPKEPPASVHKLVQRCLAKDRKQRLQAIGEARIVLQDPMAGQDYERVEVPVTSRSLSWIGWAAAAALAVIVAAVSWIHFREKPPVPAPIQRFETATPELGANMGVISPDGSKLVLFVRAGTALNRGRPAQLFIRALDSLETHPLPGTEGFRGTPFWSSDSRYIAFTTTDGKLKKIDTRVEGAPQFLCDAPLANGGFWTPDDKILFAGNGTLFQVPAGGGTATPLPGSGGPGAFDRFPTPLPDGRHFLFARFSSGSAPTAVTYLASIDEGLGRATKLIDSFPARVIPSPEDANLGYLLFLRDTVPSGLGTPLGTLMGQRFELRKLVTAGEPVLISERIDLFSSSRNGVLVLARPEQYRDQLTIFDRQGHVLQTLGEPDQYHRMSFSPDGSRIIAGRGNGEALWMFDLERGGLASRFPTDLPGAIFPVWSGDGNRIVFASNRNGRRNLYQRLSSGGGGDELLFPADEDIQPVSWSRNGRFLLFGRSLASAGTSFVITIDANGQPSGKPIVFVQRGLGIDPQFSPDPLGPPRWVAYQSTSDGKTEVYLREFDPKSSTLTPANGGPWQVSKGGGTSPRWNQTGKELFYLAPDRSIMFVELTGIVNRPTNSPKKIFRPEGIERASPATVASFSWATDGKRFLFPIPVTSTAAFPPVYVVLNWTSLLKN
jgi:Tol biopolymer transport system component